jgi:hypothetical protein
MHHQGASQASLSPEAHEELVLWVGLEVAVVGLHLSQHLVALPRKLRQAAVLEPERWVALTAMHNNATEHESGGLDATGHPTYMSHTARACETPRLYKRVIAGLLRFGSRTPADRSSA